MARLSCSGLMAIATLRRVALGYSGRLLCRLEPRKVLAGPITRGNVTRPSSLFVPVHNGRDAPSPLSQDAPAIRLARVRDRTALLALPRRYCPLSPVRLLIKRQGDMTFEHLLRRLRCKRCQAANPAPVYLVAGHHRTDCRGPDADWSLELVPPPEPKL
jgi:hypothetical protein